MVKPRNQSSPATLKTGPSPQDNELLYDSFRKLEFNLQILSGRSVVS